MKTYSWANVKNKHFNKKQIERMDNRVGQEVARLSMLCPRCKSALVVTGAARLETLEEHVCCAPVSMKRVYECSNPNCLTKKLWVVWNEDGEYYDRSPHKLYKMIDNNIFIDKNSAPFGSFQRELNVEVSKKDENYTLLKIWGWKFEVYFTYKSNKDGEILKRKRHLRIWKRDKNCDISWILYQSGIHMLLYCIKKFQRALKKDWKSEITHEFEHALNTRKWASEEWWRRAYRWYLFAFYKRLAKEHGFIGK